jgi:hypothetical protein
MNKQLLLERLARARERAEEAYCETVVQSQLAALQLSQGFDVMDANAKLAVLKTAEQKHLKEIDWILDQLDRLER